MDQTASASYSDASFHLGHRDPFFGTRAISWNSPSLLLFPSLLGALRLGTGSRTRARHLPADRLTRCEQRRFLGLLPVSLRAVRQATRGFQPCLIAVSSRCSRRSSPRSPLPSLLREPSQRTPTG